MSRIFLFSEQPARKSIKRFIHFERRQNNVSKVRCPHPTDIYCCHDEERVKEDFEIAADPCEVLLYENFNYKISFHTEEKGEWKKVEVGQIFHDDTVQYPSLTVGQIDHFPEKDCSDVNKVKMRLEPLMPLEPFGPEHPHKVKFLFNEGVNFTQRIKPCKFARNMFSKGVFAILFFLVAISAIFLHSGTE